MVKLAKVREANAVCSGVLFDGGLWGIGEYPIFADAENVEDRPAMVFLSREALTATLTQLKAVDAMLAIIAAQDKGIEEIIRRTRDGGFRPDRRARQARDRAHQIAERMEA